VEILGLIAKRRHVIGAGLDIVDSERIKEFLLEEHLPGLQVIPPGQQDDSAMPQIDQLPDDASSILSNSDPGDWQAGPASEKGKDGHGSVAEPLEHLARTCSHDPCIGLHTLYEPGNPLRVHTQIQQVLRRELGREAVLVELIQQCHHERIIPVHGLVGKDVDPEVPWLDIPFRQDDPTAFARSLRYQQVLFCQTSHGRLHRRVADAQLVGKLVPPRKGALPAPGKHPLAQEINHLIGYVGKGVNRHAHMLSRGKMICHAKIDADRGTMPL